MEFYFDDYNSVTSPYEGNAVFIAGEQYYDVTFCHGKASLPFDIALRTKYYIKVNQFQYEIVHRFIVHTKRFDIENRYDGLLGSIYYEDHTDFYIYAPTAYSIKVQFIDTKEQIEAVCNDCGVYHAYAPGNHDGRGYIYIVEHDTVQTALDPYAKGSTINSQYNYVINPQKVHKVESVGSIASPKDTIIYELHVRDVSSDPTCNFEFPGKFKGLIETGRKDANGHLVGFDYIKQLGVTHIQLLPVYDFATVDESDECNAYNWGYDPIQYNVIEGKYCTNPVDPYCRINELIDVVNAYHKENIGVIMDVVYNHVYDVKSFSFERLVPHYFFGYRDGVLSNASYCGNEVASYRYMVRKFIVDSMLYLTKTFGFSGYRFDLMGILDIETMNQIESRIHRYNPSVLLFGEGWQMPTAIHSDECATQYNYQKLNGIGFFNDHFRDTVKSICSGPVANIEYDAKMCLQSIHYSYPKQSINYVSCHDDYSLFDYFHHEKRQDCVMERMKLAYVFVLLSQGIPLLHAGCEAARTKHGKRDTYNSSIEVNQLTWDDLYKNKELMSFVRELIRMRKVLTNYQYTDFRDLENHCCVTYNNDCIEYTLENKITIYINIQTTSRFIKKPGLIHSIDGVNGQLLPVESIEVPRFSYVIIERM